MTFGDFKTIFNVSENDERASFVIPEAQRGALPGRSPGQAFLILSAKVIRHYVLVCLVWTFDLLADAIEFQGFLKINVKKSVGKQIEIIKKQ